MMHRRELGKSGLAVSALGLGCMGMSEFYGPADDEASVTLIRHALDLGMTFLDTADVYGRGHNEELVGKAIRGRRHEVILATKFGNVRADDGTFIGINGRPEYLRACCERSLRRLGVEVIDLYYQHRVDPRTPIEETVGAMAKLVREGKVRYLGLSEASAETIRRAHQVHPITALQSEYSLWTRDPETAILSVCRELGIGFISYSPLGRGFLAAEIKSVDALAANDWRRTNPRFEGENLQHNLELVRRIEEIAATKKCKPSQLALAWVLAQGDDIVPIPGTTKRHHLEDNAAALAIELSREDRKTLDRAMPPGATAGTRYPAIGMKTVQG